MSAAGTLPPGAELHALAAAPPGPIRPVLSAAPPGQWDFVGYFRDHTADVMSLFWQHVWLSVVPVVLGLLVALPLGYLARRYSWTYPPLVSIAGLLYTIPSIALFVLAPGILGTRILDPVNVLFPLTVYTVALLVRVVADGLASVPTEVLQSATAMGYGRLARLLRVELPIAVPVISSGLRVAAVSNVGLVTVATTIGTPQLGQLFSTGLQMSSFRSYYAPIVLGIVLCLLLALVLDGAIVAGTRLLTPWRRAGRPA
jgi:osmoprotectant transport system permease protein